MHDLPSLTLDTLKIEVSKFVRQLNTTGIPTLFGVTDGKAVGTYVEQTLRDYLRTRYAFTPGNAALGIDFPDLDIDLKVTSIRQPQSSSPFRSASQKVYGLGYGLIVVVYDKQDDPQTQTARLTIRHVVYVPPEKTGDYQTTFGIREILRRNGNSDDISAFLEERNLPVDEVEREKLTQRIVQQPPAQGYLTISNALQWRLQYGRVIALATTDSADGLENLLA
ncbi:MAG: restriction endonuclease [Chloroflexota bacterium]|nr:restriction endonuclease [Chloroflexota bacterium]